MTIISQPDIFCHIIKFQRQKNSKLFWFTVPVLVIFSYCCGNRDLGISYVLYIPIHQMPSQMSV